MNFYSTSYFLFGVLMSLFFMQCCNGRALSTVNESPSGNGHWGRAWRLRINEPSDSVESPRSISNSSLREVDDELTGEELATYMYHVNCNIGGLT